MSAKPELMHLLNEAVFILDGAMGTSIQSLKVKTEDYGGKMGCNEYLNLLQPEIIKKIHKGFLDAGCMGIETNSIGGSRLKLQEYGLQDKVREINQRASEIAKETANSYSDPLYVFGSIGPTGMLPSSNDPELGNITFDELVEVFEEQAAALIEGGVDALLVETSQDILEVKAAVIGCRRAMQAEASKVPIIAQVSLDPSGRMLMGTDIGSALVTIEGMGADVAGINCSTGPKEMRDSLRFLSTHSSLPISCLPNMGIPQNIDGIPSYPLDPETFAGEMQEFVKEFGISIVGGCCGSTPAHLRALVEKVKHISLRRREAQTLNAISSAMTYVTLEQIPPPLLVGERVNSQGSKKMKELLLADDIDGIANLARNQAEKGAHAIDVCVALTEVDGEAERFVRIAKELALRVAAPIMIDSTDSRVVRQVLKNYPGRVIVNSVNLENGEQKIDQLGEAMKDYGAYVIALTIDENGMAKMCGEKVAIAERTARILREKYSIEETSIIFDPLTFTLATGEEQYRSSAVETLEALEAIKEKMPGCKAILGISNVSFGLARTARAVLNSIFLYHALRKGLDLAIVNPGEITPYAEIPPPGRKLAENLIFDKNPEALAEFIAHFEGAVEKKTKKRKSKFSSPEEEVHFKIVNRHHEGIEKLLDKILEGKAAVTILNTILLPAMKEVGDKFGSGELILPFVLQSAEVMKTAVSHLEKFMEKKEGYTKGKVVLATVYGDVHDIGKNLVKTILSNNGYEVKDLGKQVPAQAVIETAQSFGADAIGLSALLVSTSRQMPIIVQEMHRAGLDIPVLIGGAAVTRHFARRSAIVDGEHEYPGGLFYAKDAFEGLNVLDSLANPDTREEVIEKYRQDVLAAASREEPVLKSAIKARAKQTPRVKAVDPPEPPFWGLKRLSGIDLDHVYECMDLNSLYRLSWGIRHMAKDDYQKILKEKFDPLRRELQEEAKKKQYLMPKAVYGYFPCKAHNEELLIFDPDDRNSIVARMYFPRQKAKKRLAITDYFREDIFDVLSLQLVTVGPGASEICETLNTAGEYSRSYFFHGLSVEAAEGLAEYIHRLIKAELRIGMHQGKRYSHGYPACPDLGDNKTLLDLLEGEKRLAVTLTSAFQFVPEQTTAALVVHHPQAEYFSV